MAEQVGERLEKIVANAIVEFNPGEKLKSGRPSTYKWLLPQIQGDGDLYLLAQAYAALIIREFPTVDTIFGPPTKCLILAPLVQLALSRSSYGRKVTWATCKKRPDGSFDEKQIEGVIAEDGHVVIVDDVVTAGTAIRESQVVVAANQASVVGATVALNRCEYKSLSIPQSGIKWLSTVAGVPTFALCDIYEILAVLQSMGRNNLATLVEHHLKEFGADTEHI